MLNLITPIISKLAAGSVKTAVVRTRNQVICWVLVTISLVFALLSLMLIAFLWLTTFLTPILSATILLLFWIFIAFICFVIGRVFTKKKENSYQQKMKEEQNSIIVATALAAIPLMAKNKKLLVFGLPIVAVAAILYFGKEASR